MFEVLERLVRSKWPDESRCEDGLFINGEFVAVIDGVTGKGSMRWGGRASGAYARDVLLEALSRLPGDIGCREAVESLNGSLRVAGRLHEGLLYRSREERLMAAVIIYSDHHRQIWSFGDCRCMINGTLYDHSKKIDVLLSEVRGLYDRTELKRGMTPEELALKDPGRTYIEPLLKQQLYYANSEDYYGYDVLDGFEIHPERAAVHQAEEGDQIVLASDGYPRLGNTLAESEAVLRELLMRDPMCIDEMRGTKGMEPGSLSFDDRCYVRLRI